MNLKKHPIFSGAILLTVTGLISRFIGFYYKIFLSRSIGARELGLYQLSLPFLSIGIALTCAGIHTALSKYVASVTGDKDNACGRKYLYAGLGISLFTSLLLCVPCYFYAGDIAVYFFQEKACAPLLRILVFCIPLECVHSCINGYYYGRQKVAIPAVGQCVEQFIRVGFVFLVYYILTMQQQTFTEVHAMAGLVAGELASVLFASTMLSLEPVQGHAADSYVSIGRRIFSLSFPVTLNKVSLTTLAGVENIFLPSQLISFGYTSTEALSVYGIFSGMALPMVFFPTVLSNSISVMLLPSISKASATGNHKHISHAVRLTFLLSMLLGFVCSFGFFLLGDFMGNFIFHNSLAGEFIRMLAWICPFLFLYTTTSSILNGLGKTRETFYISIIGSLIRLIFIFIIVPLWGFRAYLLGLIGSQICTSLTCYLRLLQHLSRMES